MFAQIGYRVALIARGADKLKTVADELSAEGAEVRSLYALQFAPHSVFGVDGPYLLIAMNDILAHLFTLGCRFPGGSIRVS